MVRPRRIEICQDCVKSLNHGAPKSGMGEDIPTLMGDALKNPIGEFCRIGSVPDTLFEPCQILTHGRRNVSTI
jgi:hypothetical protein